MIHIEMFHFLHAPKQFFILQVKIVKKKLKLPFNPALNWVLDIGIVDDDVKTLTPSLYKNCKNSRILP